MDMTLVVMAAGLGSRYGGVKQIERLGPDGEILMEYAIYDALRAGFDRIVLIIKPQMLQDVRALFGDRIEQRTGIRVEILSNSEQRFLDYKSIASKGETFRRIIEEKTAAVRFPSSKRTRWKALSVG